MAPTGIGLGSAGNGKSNGSAGVATEVAGCLVGDGTPWPLAMVASELRDSASSEMSKYRFMNATTLMSAVSMDLMEAERPIT